MNRSKDGFLKLKQQANFFLDGRKYVQVFHLEILDGERIAANAERTIQNQEAIRLVYLLCNASAATRNSSESP